MEEIKKAQGISWTEMGDKLVILDTRSVRQFHEFDEVATFLWNSLDHFNNFESLVGELTSQYDVDDEQAKNDVLHFLKELKEKNLISTL